MLRDVFYFGKKPNVHPREQYAENLSDARNKATTRDFWIINEFCDYRNFDWDFDFEFLPDEDVWAEDHNNVWPSQHQKDSGTWLCPKEPSDFIIYRCDVDPVIRKNEISENWVELDRIDHTKFDFSWHPDPTDPPYIYKWGCKFFPAQLQHVLEYRVPGATQEKYMDTIAELLPNWDNWVEHQPVDHNHFDFTWRPDPMDPPFIYVWGNKWIEATLRPTLEYHVPGATEKKYMPELVDVLPEWDRWNIPNNISKDGFDFSWRPDPREPNFIYEFATQWQKTGGPQYICQDATEKKYVDFQKAKRLPSTEGWIIPDNIDISAFDFSWHPDETEDPYIYQFGTQWHEVGGPRYIVPGATQVKYISDVKAKLLPDMTNWTIPDNVTTWDFDFSWIPHPDAPPYIYKFGTQWAMTGGPSYTVPGATEVSYVEDMIVTAGPCMDNWEIPDDIAVDEFDFSWHPYAEDDPFIYQFGTQWQKTGGPRYVVPGATQVKYVDTRILKARKLPNRSSNWTVPDNVDANEFDFSWHPDDTDPAYIYKFPTQWALSGGPTYTVPSATEVKYIDEPIAKAVVCLDNWEIPEGIDEGNFDFSWHPYAEDGAFIYQFGTQWYEVGGPRYIGPGADENSPVKYIDPRILKAELRPTLKNWVIPEGVDTKRFDFSWVPHPEAPAYIYQFGTLQDPTDGPVYVTPNNEGEIVRVPRIEIEDDQVEEVVEHREPKIGKYYIETTLDDLVSQHESELFWALNPDIDYSEFDFSWRPNIEQAQYVHAFGSSDNLNTQTYFINGPQWTKGNRDVNYVDQIKFDIKVNIDMFYVDRGNPEAASRFDLLKSKFGNKIQKTRYLNSWVDTIKRCTNRATSNLIWVLNSELDYSDFNFDYYPNPWQMKMVHVFGTQWSHWGTTFMVNRETFPEDTKYINIIEHLSNLNFVKDRRAKATQCVYDVVLLDHGNKETTAIENILKLKTSGRNVTTIKYDTSYLNTLRNYITKLPERKEHYIWVCSSVCDYSNFDFSYIIDPFSRDNLHVFPSGSQKFGDTFFLDVNEAKKILTDIEHLEDFGKINFNGSVKTNRVKEPIIIVEDDTHVSSVDKVEGFPYATLITSDNTDIDTIDIEPMNLWSPERKNIIITSTGATRIVVPSEAKDHVNKELYDYPYIKRSPKLLKSNPLDIVFLSNGETKADENWEHLLKVTENLPNRVVRVDGVNGRAKAYHAAAEASETPWLFTVFAKLKVNHKFDWNWQPDRMQVPKHYIFHAKNPVNGLVYGHQAMIAYNKKLTLNNEGKGLDFTLDDEHEVVPLVSGTAYYNTDEFSTWRTAFREVLKLRADGSETSMERLDAWMNRAEGDFAQYSIKGAVDADEYYDEVGGDFDKLKLSYEWDWLKDRFNKL